VVLQREELQSVAERVVGVAAVVTRELVVPPRRDAVGLQPQGSLSEVRHDDPRVTGGLSTSVRPSVSPPNRRQASSPPTGMAS